MGSTNKRLNNKVNYSEKRYEWVGKTFLPNQNWYGPAFYGVFTSDKFDPVQYCAMLEQTWAIWKGLA